MQDAGSRFIYAVSIVLSHEGGLTFDDSGITNFGITVQLLSENTQPETHLNLSKSQLNQYYTEIIRKLTKISASDLYKTFFWDKYHYDLFEDLSIATKVFDMAVNMGAKESHILLQRSINEMSHDQLLVDGILGTKTIHAANNLPPSYLHQELRDKSKLYYNNLVMEKPELHKYLDGWLKRAEW